MDTPDNVIDQAKRLYASTIRPVVEAENYGKMLALDVSTGDYEIADDTVTAGNRLRMKNPQAVMFMLRIGFPTAVRIGGFRR